MLQDEKLEKRAQEINDYFIKLEELKIQLEKSTEEIKTKGGMVTFEAISAHENIQQQLNYYENSSLEIVGLEKLETETSLPVQPLSTASNAEVTRPTVYYDNDFAAYVASSGWKWNITNNDTVNSGYDVFSIYTDTKVTVLECHVNTWDMNGNKASQATLNVSRQLIPVNYGYTIEFYDYSNGKSYSTHRGSSWMFFKFTNGTPSGKTLNFAGVYGHTYSGASLTGIDFGASG